MLHAELARVAHPHGLQMEGNGWNGFAEGKHHFIYLAESRHLGIHMHRKAPDGDWETTEQGFRAERLLETDRNSDLD